MKWNQNYALDLTLILQISAKWIFFDCPVIWPIWSPFLFCCGKYGRQDHAQVQSNNFMLGTWQILTGISGRSQVLFLIVFVFRYLDLFTNFVSLYNTTMKVLSFDQMQLILIVNFSSFSSVQVWAQYSSCTTSSGPPMTGLSALLLKNCNKKFYRNHDTFRIEFLVLPCFVLALLINHDFSFFEVLF